MLGHCTTPLFISPYYTHSFPFFIQVCSGVATPGPTRAHALVKFVCTLVKLFYLAPHQATWSPVLQHENYIAATERKGCS